MTIAFSQSEETLPKIQILLNMFKSKKGRTGHILSNIDSVFHVVLLKYHGLYVEHPATFHTEGPLYTTAFSDEKLIFCFSALLRTEEQTYLPIY